MLGFLKKLFFGEPVAIKKLVEEGGFLVDVRTPGEFASGHVKGSTNIPLDRINQSLAKFKGKKHIIVFCKSGMRSSQAKSILEKNGFDNVVNGGTWQSVNNQL